MSSASQSTRTSKVSVKVVVLGILVVSLLLGGIVSFYASGSPDGLEYVAEQVGFIDTASANEAQASSPLADYQASGVDNDRFAGGLAGLVGIAVTGIIAFGLFWLLRSRRQQ